MDVPRNECIVEKATFRSLEPRTPSEGQRQLAFLDAGKHCIEVADVQSLGQRSVAGTWPVRSR